MSIGDMYKLCHPDTIRLIQDMWATPEGVKELGRDPSGIVVALRVLCRRCMLKYFLQSLLASRVDSL